MLPHFKLESKQSSLAVMLSLLSGSLSYQLYFMEHEKYFGNRDSLKHMLQMGVTQLPNQWKLAFSAPLQCCNQVGSTRISGSNGSSVFPGGESASVLSNGPRTTNPGYTLYIFQVLKK